MEIKWEKIIENNIFLFTYKAILHFEKLEM